MSWMVASILLPGMVSWSASGSQNDAVVVGWLRAVAVRIESHHGQGTHYRFATVEQLHVGDRVLADSSDDGRFVECSLTSIDPRTWRKLVLRAELTL